jgi:hypothetical protein
MEALSEFTARLVGLLLLHLLGHAMDHREYFQTKQRAQIGMANVVMGDDAQNARSHLSFNGRALGSCTPASVFWNLVPVPGAYQSQESSPTPKFCTGQIYRNRNSGRCLSSGGVVALLTRGSITIRLAEGAQVKHAKWQSHRKSVCPFALGAFTSLDTNDAQCDADNPGYAQL